MAATAWWVETCDRSRPSPAQAVGGLTSADPLAAALARCQALGEAGARDTGCLQTWTQARRRFLAMADHQLAAPGSSSNANQGSVGGD